MPCCLYGRSFVIPMVGITFAAIFTWNASFSCQFYDVTYGGVFSGFPERETVTFGMGMIALEDPHDTFTDGQEACVRYDSHPFIEEDSQGSGLGFARFAGITASIIALVINVIMCCACCCRVPQICQKGMGFILFGLAPWMLFLFASHSSPVCTEALECKLGTPAILCIICMPIWILTGYGVLKMQPRAIKSHDDEHDEEFAQQPHMVVSTPAASQRSRPAGTVETSEREFLALDGTVMKIVTTTTYHEDGSKTVQETRQKAVPAAENDVEAAGEEETQEVPGTFTDAVAPQQESTEDPPATSANLYDVAK